MYKSRLNELLQKKKWKLPVYTTLKNGSSHMPRFTATVTVQAQLFQTPDDFKSMKEAQNAAARIAYDHFNVPSPVTTLPTQIQTGAPVAAPEMQPVFDLLPLSPPPSSLPMPPPGLLPKKNDANTKPANVEELQENNADTQTSVRYEGCAVTNSSMVLTIYECPVADNPSQNIQPTTTIRKYHDTTDEGPDLPSKRVKKVSSEPLENLPLHEWKTVVIPRELNRPIPEHATVKPCSNEQWIACEVGRDKEATT